MTETRWKELAEWPLIGAALAFLVAYAVMVVGQPVGPVGVVTRIVMAGTWVLFAVDFVVRLALAERLGPWFSGTGTTSRSSLCRSCDRCDCSGW